MAFKRSVNIFFLNTLLVIIGVLIALLLGELLLHVVRYNYVPLKIKLLNQNYKELTKVSSVEVVYEDEDKEDDDDEEDEDDEGEDKTLGLADWRPYHEKDDAYVAYDPNLIWKPKKDYKIFNSQGFRGESVESKKGINEYRILSLGDSNTAGPFYNSGWVEYLGQQLELHFRDINIMNGGVWGYSSWQGLKRFEEMVKLNPDVVLICFGANDAHRVTISDKDYVKSRYFSNNKMTQIKIIQLFVFLKDIWLFSQNSEGFVVPRVSLQEYQENIEDMLVIAQKNNIKVILITRPFIGEPDSRLTWKYSAPKYNDIVRKIAQKRNVDVVDLYDYFEGKEEYFFDEGHFNDVGNQLAAELVGGRVVSFFKLKLN